MKKTYIFLLIIIIVLIFILSLNKNTPYIIYPSKSITTLEILDPYLDINDDYLFYIGLDFGYFDYSLEKKLNTNFISSFYSTGFKNYYTISKKNLLKKLKKIPSSIYYYDKEWWAFDSSDLCVAIIDSNEGQKYIVLIPYSLKVCLKNY